jgi:K+-sensing histidine kinase KdpD
MHQEEQPGLADIDFPTIMAVAVHDMKNSLSLLMQSVEQLSDELSEKEKQAREHLVDVHYEASRMNTTLVQVLSLYRADMDALPTNIDECFLEELIEELVDTNLSFTKQRKIDVEVEVDEDMSWYLDKDLVFLLMHDVLVNSIRYGATKISIQVSVENEYLVISTEDNGPGYPDNMLQMSNVTLDKYCISEGRTGLGLYFARLIAQTHKNKGKQGCIKLKNNPETGGSIFQLYLP